MTPNAALTLVTRLKNYWATNMTNDVENDWLNELERLHEGTAGTALQRLIASHPDKAPSIAQFLATYRGLDTASQHTPNDCRRCTGDGWIKSHGPDCTEPEHEDCGQCNTLTWCPACDAGNDARQAIDRINNARAPKPNPLRLVPTPTQRERHQRAFLAGYNEQRRRMGLSPATAGELPFLDFTPAQHARQHLDALDGAS